MKSRYSDKIIEHFAAPNNRGRLNQPDGVGVSGAPGQGPYFVFQLSVQQGRVTEARFQCHNCGVTVACGSVLTELILEKTLDECLQIDADRIASELDGVPVDKAHVVEFALAAMRQAAIEAANV